MAVPAQNFVLPCVLGGLSFSLQSEDAVIAAALVELFGGYRGGDGTWPIVFAGRDPRGFSGPRDLVCDRVGDGWSVSLGGELAIDVRPDGARAWVGQTEDFFAAGSLQNVLRLCLVLRLAPRGGLLVHAAGVVHDGLAYVFAGKSGAGKSTLAKCCARDALLGDEMMCIDGAGIVHRAPFTGERLPPPIPLQAPLGAVVTITQGESFSLSRVNAVALLPHVLNPSRDAVLSRQLIDAAMRLPVLKATFPVPTPEYLHAWLAMLAQGATFAAWLR